MGAVLHPLNIRLFPEQIAYIVNHAGDKVILVDEDQIPAVEAVAGKLASVKAYVVMGERKAIPATTLSPVYSYEELLAREPEDFDWPGDIDENSMAMLCYTTATTGMPKGVPLTHRGVHLHALAIAGTDVLGISEQETIMPIIPMFHAAAWGIPFAAPWMGAKLVFPGARPDPAAYVELIRNERVTMAAGVPTVWNGILQILEQEKTRLPSLKLAACGGSAPPAAMIESFEKVHGIPFMHAYGMTETYPVVLVCRMKSYLRDLPPEKLLPIKAKQGTLIAGLEMKVTDGNGAEVPRDGRSMGELRLRGPWIIDEYYKDPVKTKEMIRDGWLCTGDIVTVDEEGYIQIMDRTKDLIKSGGEWISSIDLENTIMAHPAVLEAAVVGVPHPKWLERPMACVALKPGQAGRISEKDILDFLSARVAKWWLPDRIVFIDAIPKTSVGKFAKNILREKFRG
jgi:fatty-acyl-CoA synthase